MVYSSARHLSIVLLRVLSHTLSLYLWNAATPCLVICWPWNKVDNTVFKAHNKPASLIFFIISPSKLFDLFIWYNAFHSSRYNPTKSHRNNIFHHENFTRFFSTTPRKCRLPLTKSYPSNPTCINFRNIRQYILIYLQCRYQNHTSVGVSFISLSNASQVQ